MLSHSFMKSNKKFKLIFAPWWVLWCALHVYVLYNYYPVLPVVIADSLVTNVLTAGACLLIYNNMGYYLPKNEKYWYVLIISVVLSAICTGVATAILHWFFKQNTAYTAVLLASSIVRYCIAFLLLGCMSMTSLLWYVLQEQNEIQQRKTAAEQMLKDAELYKLRHQLQPHFLFNSLNSISALTVIDAEKARVMVQQLSDFLRGTLKKDDVQFITLRDELQHLQLYLEIEKVRFGHRLAIEVNYTNEAAEQKLPALLLQPAVENAIKFGLYNTLEDTSIVIAAMAENNTLVINISNPFDEEDAGAASGTGFGLESIRRRLYLLFGRYDLIETLKSNNTFTVTLAIPQPTLQQV